MGRGWEPSRRRRRAEYALSRPAVYGGRGALYFAGVEGCFGTAGGGGAEGNKSGMGRAGCREARVRASRSSCQTRGPASGPARPGCPGPQPAIPAPGWAASTLTPGVRAPGCSARTLAAAPFCAQLSAAAGWPGPPRPAGNQSPSLGSQEEASWGPCGADLGRISPSERSGCRKASRVAKTEGRQASERETLHPLSHRSCMKSKCNTHTPYTPVSKPQKLHPGDWFMKGTLPSPSRRRGAPWPRCASLTRRVFRSPAPLETAAGGAHGLPQVPTRGETGASISATSVWPSICRNSDREGKQAGPGVSV